MRETEIATYFFEDDGVMPNNRLLPVLVYLGVMQDDTGRIEQLFNQNNWRNSWTNGVFDYHHYHSNTHEVLGVTKGSATLQLGGEQGAAVHVQAGDIVVLPAGTVHKRLTSSADFQVVGAYPDGMHYNLRKGKPDDRLAALDEIPLVPLPGTDPVHGHNGPLMKYWRIQAT
ncbi:cupin domain-containing protein [Paenibacillus mendelii]|uniref:Cupin domain-containing protein n=1 Tax=Paenibacillus mendelii TaxID=206163 RepID=A0ABV6J7L2_9BACL|nr:cupin domain-containing protein [Paenibacillus mendelii]MCQ6561468.1 cupin domain-containing protein [Paenibacillus mendelii]